MKTVTVIIGAFHMPFFMDIKNCFLNPIVDTHNVLLLYADSDPDLYTTPLKYRRWFFLSLQFYRDNYSIYYPL